MGYDMFYENQDGLTESQYYFRYNIFGMSEGRKFLALAGLLAQDIVEPAWPKDESKVEDYVSADYGGLIPDWKLGSNDGWLVRPEEIERGRASAERFLSGEPELTVAEIDAADDFDSVAYGHAFVRWVLDSAKHGGFRVY